MSFSELKVCVFLENDKTDLREIFLGFRKHLFIATCIEKHCTWSLNSTVFKTSFYPTLYLVGRPGFDSLVEPFQRLKKLVLTAFLLDVQHYRDSVENRPASSVVESWANKQGPRRDISHFEWLDTIRPTGNNIWQL